MSIYKQTRVRKQQKRKRAKAVIRARNEVMKMLSSRKFKQAETRAKALLTKYPDDVRAWRLVAGVEAWRDFEAKLKGLSDAKKKSVKAQALRLWEKEVKTRNNMTAQSLAEVLGELVPETETKTRKTTKKAEKAEKTDKAETEEKEEAKEAEKPAKKTRKTAKKSSKTKKEPEEETKKEDSKES